MVLKKEKRYMQLWFNEDNKKIVSILDGYMKRKNEAWLKKDVQIKDLTPYMADKKNKTVIEICFPEQYNLNKRIDKKELTPEKFKDFLYKL